MGSNEGSQEKKRSVDDVYGVAHVVRKQDHGQGFAVLSRVTVQIKGAGGFLTMGCNCK
uniref:Uncharacterized protein n=1 Tax=Magallana gigas TaxID=29159 RepID=K1R5S2_MAGGI